MERNKILLLDIANKIEVRPDLYDQKEYFSVKDCGTACCVAGHAALFSGASLRYDYEWNSFDLVIPDDESIEGFAKKVLGLKAVESTWLFDEKRNEAAMPTVLRALAAGAELKECKKIEKEFKNA